jgi:radical SAM protein with 4Fe4S-binding SPASM domain
MKAEIKPSYDSSRERLSDLVPLDTPFTVFIEPTRLCNFRCFYCIHSTKGTSRDEFQRLGYPIRHLEYDAYRETLRQLSQFPRKLRRIVYSGLGEPLMNPELPRMIADARAQNAAERLDILTNASLLTHEMTDRLISAGTTRIQVSIQGLSAGKYREVSGVEIDFDRLIENLTYLYQHRGTCRIFIKVIDSLLENAEDEKTFYRLFGDICDQIYIEHLITLQQQMGNHGGRADDSRNLNNEKVLRRDVCPVLFYMLQIDVDGNVFPCPVNGLPKSFSLGNLHEETLVDIWNGERRRTLIRGHLRHLRSEIPVCGTCAALSCILDENENLDLQAERLLERF